MTSQSGQRWDGSHFTEALPLQTPLGAATVSLSVHAPGAEPIALDVLARLVARRPHDSAAALAGALAEALMGCPGALQAEAAVAVGDQTATALRTREHTLAPLPALPDAAPIVIVGGGVAGLSAALWVRRFHHQALVLDPHPPGGQLGLIHFPIPDLPGTPPTTGHVLRERFRWQFALHGGQWAQAALTGIVPHDGGYRLALGEQTLQARAVIVAAGIRRRALPVPSLARFVGRGLLETASQGTGGLAGRPVVVVGGGDAALENALKLARAGAQVRVIHRREAFTARQAFVEQVRAHPAISLGLGQEVVDVRGGERLEEVVLDSGERLEAAGLLVRIGWVPNTEGLPAAWRDARGYLQCAVDLSVAPGVFAAGDVRGPVALSVASAAGDGTVAARGAVAWVS